MKKSLFGGGGTSTQMYVAIAGISILIIGLFSYIIYSATQKKSKNENKPK